MSDYKLTTPLTMTDEQVTEYLAQVETLIEERKQSGSLLSIFDLIAGACLTLFLANRGDRMPAKWAFAGVRPGLLPDGLLDRAYTLNQKIDSASEAADDLDTLIDTINDIRQQAKGMQRKLTEALAGARETVKAAGEVQKISRSGL